VLKVGKMAVVDAKRRRAKSYFGSLDVEIALLAISLLFSAVVEIAPAILQGTVDWQKSAVVLRDVFSTAILIYVATQLVRIMWFMFNVEEAFAESQQTLKAVALSNDIQNSLTQTVLKIFEHDNDYMRASVVTALDKFLDTIKIESNKITLQSDYIATEVYISFWGELLRRQAEIRPKKIRVSVCHAASLGVWESGDLLAGTQGDFCHFGGEINRVLVRNAQSRQDLKEYDRVAGLMKTMRINTYFLSAEKLASPILDDFLMCQVDDEFYVLVWNADWSATSKFGDINGCTLLVGYDNFKLYRHKWNMLLDEIARGPCVDSSLTNLSNTSTADQLSSLKLEASNYVGTIRPRNGNEKPVDFEGG
jgi:hypothetical protein